MRDPADLPPELFTLILGHVLADAGVKHACQLSLLSHRWHQCLLPLIYRKWVYDGVNHSFSSLWSFLLTVLRSQHIAGMVRSLVIGNWGFNPHTALNQEFTHTLHDSEYVRDAVRRAGISALEEEIFASLSRGDRRPLMALLLTCLPNITMIDAHVPQSDPALGAVLRLALERQRNALEEGGDIESGTAPLAHLRSLGLWGEVRIETDPNLDDESGVSAPVYLYDIWPVVFFPALEILRIVEVDFMGAMELLQVQGQEDKRCSNIRHLTLVQRLNRFRGWDAQETGEDFEAFMGVFSGLKSFAASVENPHWYGYVKTDPNLCIPNPVLWRILKRHADSLESLDLYRKATGTLAEMGRLGPLTDFTRLRHLYFAPELFYGYRDSHDPTLSLKDVLPLSSSRTLESLSLYSTVDQLPQVLGLQHGNIIDDQPQHILLNKTFPALKTFRVRQGILFNFKINRVWEPFEAALRRSGVRVAVLGGQCGLDCLVKGCGLPLGGTCPAFWEESYGLRESGQLRWRTVDEQIDPWMEE
ncbi:hypothetical protein BJY01DRAFT_247764 [Aspergillus pseudoustus]|uniref:F-box domain-containing protein n=1 Tax=Aspergillus pseudoustus TaxID=1810923 RepID=A0ABR4JZQ9_9EURO